MGCDQVVFVSIPLGVLIRNVAPNVSVHSTRALRLCLRISVANYSSRLGMARYSNALHIEHIARKQFCNRTLYGIFAP
jgi:hypothetical protein